MILFLPGSNIDWNFVKQIELGGNSSADNKTVSVSVKFHIIVLSIQFV